MTHDSTNCAIPATQTHETVAAVVVTYNRKELLSRCLDALLAQTRPLDAIYVIDNASTDGTDQMISDQYAGQVYGERLPQNTGGAGGFAHGLALACSHGADWIWLLDDDAEADPRALAVLWKHVGAYPVLNCLVRSNANPDRIAFSVPIPGGIRAQTRSLQLVRDNATNGLFPWMCPFNGTLIHSSVVARIGLPRSDFFIWGDEVDYFLRIRTAIPFTTVIDSYLFHPESDADPRKMPGWKFLYRLRNQLFISSRHGRLRPLRVLKNLAMLFARKPDSVSAGLFAEAALQGILGRLGRRPEWIADSGGGSPCA